jgi:anti-sigma-K factor RskA
VDIQQYISSGVLELYVLGMTTRQETAQVQDMLLQYPELREELKAIEISLEKYAFANAIEPGAQLRNKIIGSVTPQQRTAFTHELPSTAKVIGISAAWKYVAAASVILLIGSAILNLNFYNKYQLSEKDRVSTEEQLLTQQRVNDEMKNDMSIVQSKYSEPVALHGLPAAPDAAAKIFWMKNTGEVYIDPTNLPAAPEGKQYQLWGIVDGKPVDGGLIVNNKKGDQIRIQKMKVFSNVKVQAFAITLETAGGNPTPKGDMYVMGEM